MEIFDKFFAKYSYKFNKGYSVKIDLKDSIFGLKNASLNIRNDHGGVDKPVFKVVIN